MATRGIEPAGVVLGSWPRTPDLAMRCNIRDLETLAARPLAGAIAADAGTLDAAEFLLAARSGLSPAFGGVFDAAAFRERHGI
jgi:dethiobiotin synthetase